MFRFASGLSCKLRLAENGIQRPVGGRLTWSRNYAGEGVKFSGPAVAAYDDKLTQMPKVGGALTWFRNYAHEDIKFRQCTKYKTVLAEAMHDELLKAFAEGVNYVDLREGFRMAMVAVLEHLSSRARMISTSEEITQVATTSANGEREIGVLISKALEQVGKQEGLIIISEGERPHTELEFWEGMKLDRGYVSPSFITNKKEKICVLKQARIFVHGQELSNIDALMQLLSMARRHPLLLVADDFENNFLTTLIMRKLTTGIKVCAIKAPGFGETRNAIFRTLAKFLKAMDVPSNYMEYMQLRDIRRSVCSSKVIVSENDTIILAYPKKNDEEITSEEVISIRSLKGRELFAVLKVGGDSKADRCKKKEIVTIALNAVRAAMDEGIVPGGGCAFLHASKELDKLQTTNSGQKIGVQIIQNALKMPVYTVASTVEVEGSVVVNKLLDEDNPDIGYDAIKGEYVDMIERGIMDPLKFVKETFVAASRMILRKLK